MEISDFLQANFRYCRSLSTCNACRDTFSFRFCFPSILFLGQNRTIENLKTKFFVPGVCSVHIDCGIVMGVVLDPSRSNQWPSWFGNNHGANVVYHKVDLIAISSEKQVTEWKFNFFLSLDSRTDLPKVRYATALDWFLLMSFFYCIATLLEFAGVHYFTKVGSGEIPEITDDEWEDIGEATELVGGDLYLSSSTANNSPQRNMAIVRPRGSMICPIYSVSLC